MRPVYFLSDRVICNYLEDPNSYSFMDFNVIRDKTSKLVNFCLKGKYVHSNYLYWIAKNQNLDVQLTAETASLPKNSVVVFHYDHRDLIKIRKDIVYVQVLADRPIHPIADYVLTSSKIFLNKGLIKNILYLPEPLPVKNILPLNKNHKNTPTIFRFLGLIESFPKFLFNEDLNEKLKKDNIIIKKEFNKNFIEVEDDVFFFMRKPEQFIKHSNRIDLSYHTKIPYIGNLNDDEQNKAINDTVINVEPVEEAYIEAFYSIKKEDNYSRIVNNLKQINYKNQADVYLKELISFFQKL